MKVAMPADADPILINAYYRIVVFLNGIGKMYFNFIFNKIIMVYYKHYLRVE